MRKVIFLLVVLLTTTSTNAQVLKDLYKDFLKYGTVYGAGDINNSIEAQEQTYIIARTDNVYDL